VATGTGVAPRRPLVDVLPWIGVAVGLWALIPPYVGPELANLKSKVEIADHVVPSLVMVALSVICLVRARTGRPDGSFPLVAGMTFALAGLWMTATHLPLIAQARRHQVPTTAALWHMSAGVVVLVFGGLWSARSLTSPSPDQPID